MAKGQRGQTKNLNLHIKILAHPDKTLQEMKDAIKEMVDAMNAVYSRANIVVNHLSTQKLQLNQNDLEFFKQIDVGECDKAPSEEQIELSKFRENVDSTDQNDKTDVVVYICEAVINMHGAIDGCSTHPPGVPMAVISSRAALYTLAHEIGHLLGLEHSATNLEDRLMNPSAPSIPLPPPPARLVKSEIEKMRESELLK